MLGTPGVCENSKKSLFIQQCQRTEFKEPEVCWPRRPLQTTTISN